MTKKTKPKPLKTRLGLLVTILVVILLGLGLPKPSYNTAATNGNDVSDFVPAAPTKTTGCAVASGLADRACTPGAVVSRLTKEQLCTFGYAKSARNVTAQTKQDIYAAYGITERAVGEYQVDHLISLELGGANDNANLWPQPANPTPGLHEKDQFENYLHDQVCNGKLSLAKAQQEISTDWISAYHSAGF